MAKKKTEGKTDEVPSLHALVSESARRINFDSIRFFFEAHSSIVEVSGTVDTVTIVARVDEMRRVERILDYYGVRKSKQHPVGTRGELVSLNVAAEIIEAIALFLIRPMSASDPITVEIPDPDSVLSANFYLQWGGFWIGRRPSNILRQSCFFAYWNLLGTDPQISRRIDAIMEPQHPPGDASQASTDDQPEEVSTEMEVSDEVTELEETVPPDAGYQGGEQGDR